nr:hypothetical protein BCU52_12660 [Vibrio cyclitrophicus]
MRISDYTNLMSFTTSLCLLLMVTSSFSLDWSYESSPQDGVKTHLTILSNKEVPTLQGKEL